MKWWVPVAAVAGLLAAAGVVLGVMYVNREDPGARPIDEAVDDFRSEDDTSAETDGPPAGVYQLEGSGTGSLSFPPLSQSDGASMPMTISATEGGCWTFRIDYNEAHWQDWQLCREGEKVIETGGQTYQRWDLGATSIENLSTFVCEPPVVFVDLAATVGDTDQRSCTGTNQAVDGETITSGTDTVVATEELTIGGESVGTVHIRSDQVASGAQNGTIVNELWFRTSDGLPVQGRRSSLINSDSPVGTITYTEEGNWELASLDAQD